MNKLFAAALTNIIFCILLYFIWRKNKEKSFITMMLGYMIGGSSAITYNILINV